MQYIATAKEMKALEKYAMEEMGIPSLVLMERAALGISKEIKGYPGDRIEICVVCGCGNNGADGVAVARQLMEDNYKVDVVILGKEEKFSEEMKVQMSIYKKMGGNCFTQIPDKKYDFFVDAIFGIGLTREITDEAILNAIDTINSSGAYIYSVDIPSGIHTDTGCVMGKAVKANRTIFFTCDKVGLCLYPGKEYAGMKIKHRIGICEEWIEALSIGQYRITIEDCKRILKDYPSGHKGTFGKVLVIAGNHETTGAALLCAKAVMKSGAGMVKVLSNSTTLKVLRTALPEAMTENLDDIQKAPEIIKKAMDWADAVVCGPGIGTDDEAYKKVEAVLKEFPSGKKLVLDADAINLIAKNSELRELTNEVKEIVYTPHMMELARFTGINIDTLKTDLDHMMRVKVCNENGIYVCKDSVTRVYAKDKPVFINTGGNSGMATAGCGDVLAGMVAAFVARRGVDFYDGIIAAVSIHTFAGYKAADKIGKNSLMASDIIKEVTRILKSMEDIS